LAGKTAFIGFLLSGERHGRLTELAFPRITSWSPDGKWIAATVLGPPQRVLLISAEIGQTQPLTADALDHAAFSPDGHSLAASRCTGMACDVVLLELDGSSYRPKGPSRKITNHGGVINGLSWLANGEEIVYSAAGNLPGSLYRVRVTNPQSAERLELAGTRAFQPIATDNRLAFEKRMDDTDIFRFAPGQQEYPVIASSLLDNAPQISPDGAMVAFSSE
jgi:Tol biopolymer transport system component